MQSKCIISCKRCIISLAQGIHACAKLKKLPPEEVEILETEQLAEGEEC